MSISTSTSSCWANERVRVYNNMLIMKRIIYLITLLSSFVFLSCSGDSSKTGSSLLSDEDRIIVGCDTFSTSTSVVSAQAIYSTPDSFLLGECDSRFGTIHADILAQFTCPVGFTFPENAVVDSACLFFYYDSWFGDGNSPLALSIYRIDKQPLSYNTSYAHDIDVNDFCTVSDENMVIERQRIIVPARPTDSISTGNNTYTPYVKLKLKDSFAKELFSYKDFSSLEAFTKAFKGLYIASGFGSANLLHVNELNIALYYHFSYNKAGKDTVVNDIKGYYANSEVRQVNRYIYYNEDIEQLRRDSDSVCYIVSPANIYTRVSIPIKQMAKSITFKMLYATAGGDTLTKRPYINKAELVIRVLNQHDGVSKKTRDDWAQPANVMMLIKENNLTDFFAHNRLPSDTSAILGFLTKEVDGENNTSYYYTYDIATLLTTTIRDIQKEAIDTAGSNIPDRLDMLLIPVTVDYGTTSSSYYSYTASSTSISAIKYEQTVSATVIQSAKNTDDPLDIEVVFSGF